MPYWLMKSEPNSFSLTDLQHRPLQTEPWDGVRNYQVRNLLRDQIQVGDLAFFYHSNCANPGIVGLVEIVRAGYPDHTALDPCSKHFDPKSSPEQPRWYMVDVRYLRHTRKELPLSELRRQPELAQMLLLRKGNRLSITPVTKQEWDFILSLESC